MSADPIPIRRLAIAAGLWFGLYLGVAAVLFALFSLADGSMTVTLAGLGLSLSIVVTGLALLAVLVDRMVFARDPDGYLTRQSLWVLVFVGLTVAGTALFYPVRVATPGDAVLFGVAVSLPTTIFLFTVVNLARYRSMEHGA